MILMVNLLVAESLLKNKDSTFDSKYTIMPETLADKIMKRANATIQIQYL